MPQRSHSLSTLLAAWVLLFVPLSGATESTQIAGSGPASASLQFLIVVPAVMKVLENSHPLHLVGDESGAISAEQRLVVVSNMKRGFCVTLRMAEPWVGAWQMKTAQAGGVTLSPLADGYQLCTTRPGRYDMLLEHAFDARAAGEHSAVRWPVQTHLSSL